MNKNFFKNAQTNWQKLKQAIIYDSIEPNWETKIERRKFDC